MSAAPAPAPPLDLDGVAAALGLGLTPAQRQHLLDHMALLQRWNGTYNLTAASDPAALLSQHLADCLAVVPSLKRVCGEGPMRVLDAGSGGGLPGVVLASLLPALEVVCVDAVGKKAAFLRQVALALPLPNLQALHARVEQLQGPPFDLVTCRAFASLADFTRLTLPRLAAGGVWMAMKGKVPDDEIAALPSSVAVFHVERLTVPGLEAERCLVWMRAKPV